MPGETWFPARSRRGSRRCRGRRRREVLPARARLLHVMGLIAGKWPHSLAFQPGGVTRALELGEKMRLHRHSRRISRLYRKGPVRARRWSRSSPSRRRSNWRILRRGRGRFRRLPAAGAQSAAGGARPRRLAADLFRRLSRRGRRRCSRRACSIRAQAARAAAGKAIGEDVAFSYLRESAADPAEAVTLPDAERADAYSWAKAPRLAGEPAEVGAAGAAGRRRRSADPRLDREGRAEPMSSRALSRGCMEIAR